MAIQVLCSADNGASAVTPQVAKGVVCHVLGLHVPMPELDAAFPAAARWQASRVLVSGEVDNRGNTRTGVGKEPGYNGQPKGINHGEVTMALTLHGIIHRDPVVMAASDRALRELAGRLARDLELDARAIFATGFSNGGDLSYYLAAQTEPFVAAVAPVGGTMMSSWGQGLRPAAPIPVLAVNMVDDTTTRWTGDPMNRDGWGAYLPVEEVRKAWVAGLGLERSEVLGLAGGLRRHRAWTAKDGCEALLYEIPTGGHRWPANLGDAGKSTAAEIVEFFERQREKKE
jgi:hypothetical protein